MGETLLKGYLQIKCANPGRIVRKVCHSYLAAWVKFLEGVASHLDLGLLDSEMRRLGERDGLW